MKKIYIIHFVATALMLNFCILLAGCGGNEPAETKISISVSSLTLSAQLEVNLLLMLQLLMTQIGR